HPDAGVVVLFLYRLRYLYLAALDRPGQLSNHVLPGRDLLEIGWRDLLLCLHCGAVAPGLRACDRDAAEHWLQHARTVPGDLLCALDHWRKRGGGADVAPALQRRWVDQRCAISVRRAGAQLARRPAHRDLDADPAGGLAVRLANADLPGRPQADPNRDVRSGVARRRRRLEKVCQHYASAAQPSDLV